MPVYRTGNCGSRSSALALAFLLLFLAKLDSISRSLPEIHFKSPRSYKYGILRTFDRDTLVPVQGQRNSSLYRHGAEQRSLCPLDAQHA